VCVIIFILHLYVSPPVYNLEPFRIMIDNQQWGEWMYRIHVLFQTKSERRRRFQYSISACTAISVGLIFFSFSGACIELDSIPVVPTRAGHNSKRAINSSTPPTSLVIAHSYVFRGFSKHALGSHFFSLFLLVDPIVCVCVCARLSTSSQHLVITFLSSRGAKKKQHSRSVTFILSIDVAEKVTLSL